MSTADYLTKIAEASPLPAPVPPRDEQTTDELLKPARGARCSATVDEFAENVKAFWKQRGGYRPAAENMHLDAKYNFHANPNFIPARTLTRFSPATLKVVADDLARMADEIEAAGLVVDRSIVDEFRDAVEGAGLVPYQLADLARELWPHPVRPAYPDDVPQVLHVQVAAGSFVGIGWDVAGGTGIIRNFECEQDRYVRFYVERKDSKKSGYYDVRNLRTQDGAPVDAQAVIAAVKSVTPGPWSEG